MQSPRADRPGAALPQVPPSATGADPQAEAEHPHNFAPQKDLHRQIRNDPDYDDWEYGTEPLPQEAWPAPKPAAETTG